MALLPIIKIGHPTLRKVAQPVTEFDEDLITLIKNMIETMRLNEGIGLAAPQVNVSKRFFIIDKKLINEEWEAQAFINPRIIEKGKPEPFEEGCLSIPDVRAEVIRPEHITVEYQSLKKDWVTEKLDGLLARVFLHEYDHLEGILFVDLISPLKKKLIESQLKEIEGAMTYR